MDYQVWTKEEYGELWTRHDCGDLSAARRLIDESVRRGQKPMLTVEVPYELNIKIGEVGSEKKPDISAKEKFRRGLKEGTESETKEDKAKHDKGPGVKSDSEVRRGDEGSSEKLD